MEAAQSIEVWLGTGQNVVYRQKVGKPNWTMSHSTPVLTPNNVQHAYEIILRNWEIIYRDFLETVQEL
jgi:hypothetical protein